MSRYPDPQLARQWRERLDRFDRSEWTVAEFCQREGYSTASFYQWRRKLRSVGPQVAPAFVPVQLDASDLQGGVRRVVEIDLPGGAVVKLPAGATADESCELIVAIVQATTRELRS